MSDKKTTWYKLDITAQEEADLLFGGTTFTWQPGYWNEGEHVRIQFREGIGRHRVVREDTFKPLGAMFLDPTETYTLTWNRDEGVFTVPVVVPQVFFVKDDNANEQRSQTLGVSSTTEFSLVGNPYVLTPNTGTRPMAAALSQTRVALYNRDAGNNLLRTLDFNGTDWVQTGNALTMSFEGANTPDFPSFTAINATDIAMADVSTQRLRVMQFDGTDWAQVGNALDLSAFAAQFDVVGLAENRVALFENFSNTLRVYDWDGTDFSQVGIARTLNSFSGQIGVAALSATRVCIIETQSDFLRVYDFDGTNWNGPIGNDTYSLPNISLPAMCALSSRCVAIFDSQSPESITAYDWDGTDWTPVGTPFTTGLVSGTLRAWLTALHRPLAS